MTSSGANLGTNLINFGISLAHLEALQGPLGPIWRLARVLLDPSGGPRGGRKPRMDQTTKRISFTGRPSEAKKWLPQQAFYKSMKNHHKKTTVSLDAPLRRKSGCHCSHSMFFTSPGWTKVQTNPFYWKPKGGCHCSHSKFFACQKVRTGGTPSGWRGSPPQ